MPRGKPQVFVSYSSADKDIARRLTHDLASAGVDVWYDEFQLKAGDPVLQTIREGIERSDALLVLVSANSITSKWVDREVREAFEKHGDTGAPAIIPIRLDNTEPPQFLRSIKYIDIRTDYSEGLRQLLRALEAESPTEKVRDVIDAAGLAEELAKDRESPRGAGFYITTILSVLTLIATVFTAWPAFKQVFGERPKLFYSVTQSQLSIPDSLDSERIRKLLRNEGLPDSSIRIQLINRGSKDADEIKIGVTVDGAISSFSSEPGTTTNPVWVSITPPSLKPDDKSATLLLKDLVPNRNVVAEYQYHAESKEYTCDVVADGLLADQVSDIGMVPKWSLWQEIKTPVLVFVVGLVVSILLGVFVTSLANEKFRELVVAVVDVVSPTMARLLMLFDR